MFYSILYSYHTTLHYPHRTALHHTVIMTHRTSSLQPCWSQAYSSPPTPPPPPLPPSPPPPTTTTTTAAQGHHSPCITVNTKCLSPRTCLCPWASSPSASEVHFSVTPYTSLVHCHCSTLHIYYISITYTSLTYHLIISTHLIYPSSYMYPTAYPASYIYPTSHIFTSIGPNLTQS